jgi:adenine phosphoribosyltransferase
MPDRRTAQEALTRLTVDVPDWPEEGVTFKDITPVLADHHAFSAIIAALAAAGRDDHGNVVVDKVVGMEARGFILAAPVALALGIGFVPVRKSLEVHRDGIAPGERVLMVDDVLATGGTVDATRRLIEACGGVATGASVLMELSFLEPRTVTGDLPIATLLTI